MASYKSPTPDLRARAREVVREIVERDFAGNQTAAAAAWKLRQATISNALNPRLPAALGPKLLEAIARHDPEAAARIFGVGQRELSPAAQEAMARLASEGVEARIAHWAARSASEVSPEMPATLHTARVIASLALTVGGLHAVSSAEEPHRTAKRQR